MRENESKRNCDDKEGMAEQFWEQLQVDHTILIAV